MTNFEVSINRLLKSEGGYTSNPNDPGGETNWGISKRSYPNLNIKDLTRDQAVALYKRDFWDRLKLENLPLGVAYQILDFAVNSGAGVAIRTLQKAIGVADDGVIGDHTMAAFKAIEPHDLIMRFTAERMIFMTNCAGWPTFSKGWMRRLAANLKIGADDV
ncbi:glycosyl hydrolase 108 family protein [Undibacterium sp. RTI2.1]|uniref:glycoside hydrolase family 108 protein n=1 Tax=unclassified Undibacterium TaxID=2630295 RepID=UPI002AB527AB|nr:MULTISPECIES: glycosyl hydrolase 108 family protein [unclassified Undibacterium]MDY7537690.1 glycosyl hydrolase 108 family protein [Undibacterium sp. 5I1]MEB0029292.1 glycosyl hydrolase 108 family protein [Undibacterium sp. RTI2.1]MEB0115600.1 glycosyl hydrolase 108 family protein [Undibacterium sp. RTI2.2]MEB0256427.1 glycosyl hydrolase 108 family protein [Undibacterium sp. 5I1]